MIRDWGMKGMELIQRTKQGLRRYWLFLFVLALGVIIWSLIFDSACSTFEGVRPYRAVWNGAGELPIFGYTVTYNFEGWADYDYYYMSWADQFLDGYLPYTEGFNHPTIDGTEYNTPYFFPPLYVYMCTFGRLLPIQPCGIGLVITVFGFITVFPVYGIAEYLSSNRQVAVISAATYLLNPLTLYYIAFEWLNPAPFIFFSLLGFLLLMKKKRLPGTLAIVTAALFKQTAFFFGLPLVAYLLKRAPEDPVPEIDETQEGRPPGDELDLLGFAGIVVVVVAFAAAVSLPYLPDIGNYFEYVFQRAGATYLRDLTVVPASNSPITLAVPFISLGFPPWFIQGINLVSYYSVGLVTGVIPLLALMLLEEKDDRNLREYWRTILYLTLLLVLWLHIWSPRGIYKYYTVAILPFISIMSSCGMCSKREEPVPLSLSMVVLPIGWSFLMLLPDRNIYILYLLLTLLLYLLYRVGLGNVLVRLKAGLSTGAIKMRNRFRERYASFR
ncbi:hypothetical protein EU538_06335 [Candidatus Thorarchaeota archaeon]|nr:MAG: hypothetical protein EU538_06335 [Candidatus Thorarchaeota archaeon]